MTDVVIRALDNLGMTACAIDTLGAPLALWMISNWSRPDLRHRALLSAAELERAGQLRAAQLRDRYVMAHAACYLVVGTTFAIPSRLQRIGYGDRGKPMFIFHPDIQFSLSYCDEGFVIGVARNVIIGVDVERVRTIEDAAELAELHYAPSERSALGVRQLVDTDYDCRFLQVWTRKEACLKAAGLGIADMPLAEIDCGTARTDPVRVGPHQLRTGTTQVGPNVVSWAWESRNEIAAQAAMCVPAG